MDLIERQKAIDALADMHCKSDENGYVWIIRSDAWARIDALPPAQPEPKTGKWIRIHWKGFRCSRCNRMNEYFTNFCPNCGAKMEVEHE